MQNKRFIYTEGTENLKPSLPESYTNILPAKNAKKEPLNRTGTTPCSNTNNLNGIDLWIKQLSSFDFNIIKKKRYHLLLSFQLILHLQCRIRSPLYFPFWRIQSTLQPWFAITLKLLETLSIILIQVK